MRRLAAPLSAFLVVATVPLDAAAAFSRATTAPVGRATVVTGVPRLI